jgi:hypothetical protein
LNNPLICIYHHIKPERFDLRILSFLIYIWGILNITNGIVIFNHDFEGTYLGSNYYIIIGTVRILIGLVTLLCAWYIWVFSDEIVIFRQSDEHKDSPHGEEIITTREGGRLHFKD